MKGVFQNVKKFVSEARKMVSLRSWVRVLFPCARDCSPAGRAWFQLLFDVVISLVFIRAFSIFYFTLPSYLLAQTRRRRCAAEHQKLICLARRAEMFEQDATTSRIELSAVTLRACLSFSVLEMSCLPTSHVESTHFIFDNSQLRLNYLQHFKKRSEKTACLYFEEYR